MKGISEQGTIVEGIGTSYAAPRVAKKIACILDELSEKDLLLAKAMLVHSARMNLHDDEEFKEKVKYYGFGIAAEKVNDVILCSESEVTLLFKQKITRGSHLELIDFPYPKSLIKNDKYVGEIFMTLAYNPKLDSDYGQEYCRSNIDVSFGTININEDGKFDFHGQVPVEKRWDSKFEKEQVENGFKWSPIKTYHRKLTRGIALADGWKLRVDLTPRYNADISVQEFVLIVTIKDPTDKLDIYTDIVQQLREKGFITNDLQVKQLVRQRQ